jgi:hypothetical protein
MAAPSADPQLNAEYLAANKGPQTLALIILFPALALLIVGLRLYTRIRIVKSPSHEDFAIALAMVSSSEITVFYVLSVNQTFSIGCSVCQAVRE